MRYTSDYRAASGKRAGKRVSIITIGCKVNQSESDSLMDLLIERGYSVVDRKEPAEIVVINSCAVTGQAEAKTRGAIALARRISPEAKIIVTGCYSQKVPEKVKSIEGVNFVVGNVEKSRIVELIELIRKGQNGNIGKVVVSPDPGIGQFISVPKVHRKLRTRAFLKVQDGCSYRCSYCIVPRLRGKTRSRDIYDCVEEARKMVDCGYKEIVVTGINIGTYCSRGFGLTGLVRELLKIDGIGRVRLSSVEPDLIDDELIELVSSEDKVCSHFHIPLQHADDRILARMRRRYTIRHFTDRIERIFSRVKNVCVGTDVIVGFPGEDSEAFENLFSYLKRYPFAYFHVFRFSERESTPAVDFDGKVGAEEKKRRAEKLQALSADKRKEYLKTQEGKVIEVLFEKYKERINEGLSDNYVRVVLRSDSSFENMLVKVKVLRSREKYVEGEKVG